MCELAHGYSPIAQWVTVGIWKTRVDWHWRVRFFFFSKIYVSLYMLWNVFAVTNHRYSVLLILDAILGSPAPKKRPMISGSKSVDFCLPSRGYRMLFKNEFLLFQFRFKPKISSRKLLPSLDTSKISPKIKKKKKRFRNHCRNAK